MKYTLKFREIELGIETVRIRHFEAKDDIQAVRKVIAHEDCGFDNEDLSRWLEEESIEQDAYAICEEIENYGYLTSFTLTNDSKHEDIWDSLLPYEVDEKTVVW